MYGIFSFLGSLYFVIFYVRPEVGAKSDIFEFSKTQNLMKIL